MPFLLCCLQETDLGALSQLERMDAVNEVRLLVSINHPNVVSWMND
jgi:NIMA (never in mitosis gene a)-related kinase